MPPAERTSAVFTSSILPAFAGQVANLQADCQSARGQLALFSWRCGSRSASSTPWPTALPLPMPPKPTASHRVTIYRWMKTCQPCAAAPPCPRRIRPRPPWRPPQSQQPRLGYPARHPRQSQGVPRRPAQGRHVHFATFPTAQDRLVHARTGPDPDGKKLLDSAIIEQDYDSLPGLYSIEKDDPQEAANANEREGMPGYTNRHGPGLQPDLKS